MRNVKNRIDALEKRLIVKNEEDMDIEAILRQNGYTSIMSVVVLLLRGYESDLRKKLPGWVVDWFIDTLEKGRRLECSC